ncbi:hypothetical protein JTE90_027641 [Oedothorax gibbosus]|uniref:EGF-like domain-containing protein n=1 Tax=Oedothorax gibbosus TaxID=931172 RepID=A0AAV6TKA8_9ARAC|nr:hypothetical protein JTE90_027641 [Oedothorax gibbosus]
MKWALVLALVLCCGSTRGETENDSIESLDKLTEQLEQELLFRPRTLLANKHKCGEIECQNGAIECTGDGKCQCPKGYTGDDCSQVGTCDLKNDNCKNGGKCEDQDGQTFCTCAKGLTGDLCEFFTPVSVTNLETSLVEYENRVAN